MKNRQSFGGRGTEKRIRIRRSFSNEKNPPAICCRNRKTHSKPSVASPSPASAPVRSLYIKWATTFFILATPFVLSFAVFFPVSFPASPTSGNSSPVSRSCHTGGGTTRISAQNPDSTCLFFRHPFGSFDRKENQPSTASRPTTSTTLATAAHLSIHLNQSRVPHESQRLSTALIYFMQSTKRFRQRSNLL